MEEAGGLRLVGPILAGVTAVAVVWICSRYSSRLAPVIRPTRAALLSLLAGFVLLFVTGQGREIIEALTLSGHSEGDPPDLVALASTARGWQLIWLWLGVLFWAVQCWHWSRVSIYLELGTDRQKWGPNRPLAEALPRIYGLVAHALAVGSVVWAWWSSGIFLRDAILLGGWLSLSGIVFWRVCAGRQALVDRAVVWLSSGGWLARRSVDLLEGKEIEAGQGIWHTVGQQAPASTLMLLGSLLFFLWNAMVAGYLPVENGYYYGSAAIAFGALGTWVSILSLLAILSGHFRLPFLTTAIVAVFVSSWAVRDGHKVRTDPSTEWSSSGENGGSDPRPTLAKQIERWNELTRATRAVAPTGEAGEPMTPVVFVAAAGGGLRAAYWTATALAGLGERYPGLVDNLVAISGVSGGSVGATVAVAAISELQLGRHVGENLKATVQNLLSNDFLAPTLAALLYTDALGTAVSSFFCLSDRATALESAWEAAWNLHVANQVGRLGSFPLLPLDRLGSCFGRDHDRVVRSQDVCASDPEPLGDGGWVNPLGRPFLELWRPVCRGKGWVPMLFLNATHEERGKRVITSNVQIGLSPFADAWDLHALLERDLWTVTAMHNSARFTFVSPAGRVLERGDSNRQRGHVLDGGYFENFGALTLREVIEGVFHVLPRDRYFPVVIQISSDPNLEGRDLVLGPACATETSPMSFQAERDASSPYHVANEALAPLAGLFATREARGIMATRELARSVACDRGDGQRPGVYIHLAMCGIDVDKPPLGWAMDARSQHAIDGLLDASCNASELAKLDGALRAAPPITEGRKVLPARYAGTPPPR